MTELTKWTPERALECLRRIAEGRYDNAWEELEGVADRRGGDTLRAMIARVGVEALEAAVAEIARLKSAAPEPGAASPSDEAIIAAIRCVETWGCKHSAAALRKVAQRAGVKL